MAPPGLRSLLAKALRPSSNPQFARCQQQSYSSGSSHGEGITYKGVTLHSPSKWHTYTGEGMAGLMWFWIFVRAYHDGPSLLFGHAHHFEHEAHQSDHHDH